MTERLNRLRQVKDVVYSVPVVASYESNFNINYEINEDFYEKLTNLVDSTPNDQDLGAIIRNLIKNNKND